MNPFEQNKSTIQIEDLGCLRELSDLEVEKIAGGAGSTSNPIQAMEALLQQAQRMAMMATAANISASSARNLASPARKQ
ncbi:MAG: hypothetical protein IGR93_00805 [Hydrococcus sp. C42_A2020_068]|uniref:hypothetical protein n=1 Tax=Pleurocapsa sp. PCC 7327 TaxID=118163 RepID=UPI00029FF98A|nr:hypothetical protein [Pleurocapsa sp. PCC 7327]AFY78620.1 hypothetical protein Ple7327_3412 [Pleurocapsa sp. PCC 7327]MBF2018673.1 hypothetical protein [Hydrococcus sp. C42_A2020_068]